MRRFTFRGLSARDRPDLDGERWEPRVLAGLPLAVGMTNVNAILRSAPDLGFRIFEGAEQGAVGVAGGVAAGLMA